MTGADAGTLDAPNFSLKYLFKEHILSKIAVLVAPGDISKAVCLSFKATTQAHIFVQISTTM